MGLSDMADYVTLVNEVVSWTWNWMQNSDAGAYVLLMLILVFAILYALFKSKAFEGDLNV